MPTILLTSPDRTLAQDIERALPGSQVIFIGGNLPESVPAGAVWCFVDWLLPDTSGLELCRRLRAATATMNAHITMVLDADDDTAKRRSLAAGADDYMLEPLTAEGVLARVRGPEGEPVTQQLVRGQLTLDAHAHQVRWNGRLVVLRPREISLLAAFLQHPDRLLSRSRLIALAGNACDIHDERTVDVWVGRLRRSLEAQGVPGMVRTVRSHGYVLDTPELS